MKMKVIYIMTLLLCQFHIGMVYAEVYVEDIQKIENSDENEGKSMADGGKVLVDTIYVPSTGGNVTLYTHASSNQYRPSIVWLASDGTTVLKSGKCGTAAENNTNKTVCDASTYTLTLAANYSDPYVVYAVSYPATNTLTSSDNNKVDYTKKYVVTKPVNFPSKFASSSVKYYKHRLVSPQNVKIRLVPKDVRIDKYFFNGVQATNFKFKLPNGTFVDPNYGKESEYKVSAKTVNGDYPFDYAYSTWSPNDNTPVKYECYAYNGTTQLGKIEEWTVVTQKLPEYPIDTLYFNGFETYTNKTGTSIQVGLGKNVFTNEWVSDYAMNSNLANINLPTRSEYGLFTGNGPRSILTCSGTYSLFMDAVSLPDRLFHYVVETVSSNDSLLVAGSFKTRASVGDTCNLRFVISDYTNNVRGNEIVSYNTGNITTKGYYQYGVSLKVPVNCSRLLVEIFNNTFSQSDNNDIGMDNLIVRRLTKFPKEGIYKIKNVKTGRYLTNSTTVTLETPTKDGASLWYLKDSLKTGSIYLLNLDTKTTEKQYLSVSSSSVSLQNTISLIPGSMKNEAATGDTVVFGVKDDAGTLSAASDEWVLEPESLLLAPQDSSVQSSMEKRSVRIHPVSDDISFSSAGFSISGQLLDAYSDVSPACSASSELSFSFSPILTGTYSYYITNTLYSKKGAVPTKFCKSPLYVLEVSDSKIMDGIYKIQNINTGRFLKNSTDSTSYKMNTDGTTLWYLSASSDNESELYLLNLDTTTGVVQYLYVEDQTIKFTDTKTPITWKALSSKYAFPFVDNAGILKYDASENSYEWVLSPVSLALYTNTFKVYVYGMNGSVNIPIYRNNEYVRIADPKKLQLNITSISGSSAKCSVGKSDAGLFVKADNLTGYSDLIYNFTNNAYAKGGLVPAVYRTSKSFHTILSLNVASGDWFHIYFNKKSNVWDVKREADGLNVVVKEKDSKRETQNWQIFSVGVNLYTFVNANGLVMTGTGDGGVVLKAYSNSPYQVWQAITSTNADEIGYQLINQATGGVITSFGDYLTLSPASSTYDPDQYLVAEISDYIYTIRIPEGNAGFSVNFQNKSAVDNVHVWIDDPTSGLSSYNFDYNMDVSTLLENGSLNIPDLNGFISGLKEGVYLFKMEVKSSDQNSCQNIYPFKLKVLPRKLIWTGADEADANNWNNDANWTSENGNSHEIPIPLSSVLIPGGKSSYPILVDTVLYLDAANVPFRDQNFRVNPAVDTLYVKHGGELARTDYLVYNVAKYNIDALETNRWYGMTSPLKDVYSGDYAFRNVNPLLFMREHNMLNPDDGSNPGISWTNSFRTATENVSGIGFAVNVSPLYYYGMTWASDDAIDYTKKGTLRQMQNLSTYGVSMEFPATNMSFQFYDSNTKHPTETVQNLKDGDRSKAGRFIYENDKNEVDIVDGVIYTTEAPSNVVAESFVLVPNPFMSHLNFSEFYKANSSLIANEFKILNGMEPSYSSFVANETGEYMNGENTAYGNIAPLQSFIVTALGNGPFSLKFTPEMSVTDLGTPRLRSSMPLTDKILITAKDAYNTTNAVLLIDAESSTEYDAEEDSKCLFVESSKAPTIAIVSGENYLDFSREPKLRESTPLALMALGEGSVDLEVQGAFSLLQNGDKLYFIDQKNAVMDEIDSDDYKYTFTSDGTTILNRFFLMFKSAFSSSEDLIQNENSSIQLYRDGYDAAIISQNAPIRKVSVFFSNGDVYSVSENLNCDFVSVPLPIASKVVLVTVVTDAETRTFKVF